MGAEKVDNNFMENLSDKRELWMELIYWKNKLDVGEWVVRGDFNSVKKREERRGKENHRRGIEMEEFKCFIENMELIDMQAESRLDRILLSGGLISKWDVVAQDVGKRDVSDHKPKEWNSIVIKGSPAFIIKEKLSFLRGRLRWWNLNVFGKVELKIEEIVDELNPLEDKLFHPNANLTEADFASRRIYQESFWHKLHIKEGIINQKSSHKWAKEGDNNTRLFHATMKLNSGAQIRFQTSMLHMLSMQESRSLEEPFTVDEIKQAVFEGDGDKSPGPDGFNLEFMKKCWDIVGDLIVLFIQEFHKGGKLPKVVTASFLALIPKCENPLNLEDYRTICLISRLLKLISLILTARMRNVIGKLISNNQTTFVPGR
ncbi:uncharacterized protein LOC131648711 [Vicia villosa]|uniref:uncharacterized protein LOC131648711 n=1 Tax=Vicia villosa TaxID=3911 RepID=UPI00273BCBA3|nr:uncharacterized protein LOC131648711 [Vicia villosa]